jgi:hypothetical protein
LRKYAIFFLPCIILWLISCSATKSNTPNQLGVLYTNASQPDSAFITLDNKGTVTSQTNIPAMGVFQVTQGDNGNLLFPVQFDNKVFTYSPKEKLTKTTVLPFPLFIKEVADFRVTTYNSNLNSGTVEWKQAGHTTRVSIAGFPRVATFDQQHVYVFASIIQQKKPVIYVLAKTTGKIEKVIPLAIDQANDLHISGHTLLVTTTADEKRIGRINLTTWNVDYITLPEAQPEYILSVAGKLLVTYQGSTSLTILDSKSLQVMEQVTLPQPVLKAKIRRNNLYVLSQIPNSGQGIIGVYQLSNWKLVKKITLPTIRSMRVQDFVVF